MGVLASILDLFFPPKCIFCGKPLDRADRSGRICRSCRHDLPYNEQLIPPSGGMAEVCAPLMYGDSVRHAIHDLKFHGRSEYAAPLGRVLADEIRRRFDGRYDVITYAPVSDTRRKSRGYDQSMLLAQSAALELGDVAVCVLEKFRDTPQNSQLNSPDARTDNVRGVYRVTAPELVSGKRVLLIDDVYTTGATMRECAKMLIDAGAVEVLGAAVARAGGH